MPRFGTFRVTRDGLVCVAERPDRESRVRERAREIARVSRERRAPVVEREPDDKSEPVLHTGVYL